MTTDFVFSWAENEQGDMVHVDEVPRGIACGCKCPCCHERLLARHGGVKQHGFAHHSDTRRANLEICYMVTMYKLAEQIVQRARRVYTPSYYGISPEKVIEFDNVRIDNSFERLDKQPDVVATTENGQQYLIEFRFQNKVQHKAAIDYKNMNCLEIDLSGQRLETIESFLLSSPSNRKWVNNVTYFSQIESLYGHACKPIRVVEESECRHCELGRLSQCAGVRSPNGNCYLVIENNGRTYRMCKLEVFQNGQQKLEQEKTERKKQESGLEGLELGARRKEAEDFCVAGVERDAEKRGVADKQEIPVDSSVRTCFQCKYNLKWANRESFANCGAWESIGVSQKTSPDSAQTCKRFSRILP